MSLKVNMIGQRLGDELFETGSTLSMKLTRLYLNASISPRFKSKYRLRINMVVYYRMHYDGILFHFIMIYIV